MAEHPILSRRTAILQALIHGPAYGLEIMSRVEGKTAGEIRLPQGSVYPLLRDLEREGLLRSFEGEATQERGGRPRIYYELTAEGLRVAREERQAVWSLLGEPLPT